MNFSKLLLVTMVTASALSLTGQAAAFTPNWGSDKDNGVDGVDVPGGTIAIWHAGASASTSSLQRAVVDAICEPNPTNDPVNAIDVLEDARSYQSPPNPAGPGGPAGIARPAFWTVACTAKAGIAGVTAGQHIMWSKRDEGGSGVGVGPLAGNTAIAFMKPSTGPGPNGVFNTTFDPTNNLVLGDDDTNCPGNGALNNGSAFVGGVSTTFNDYDRPPLNISGLTYNIRVHNCINFTYKLAGPATPAVTSETGVSDDAVSRIPDIGTSDIEPDKFFSGGENDPTADFDLDINPRVLTNVPDLGLYFGPGNSQPVAYLTFGIPVNLLMYQDLQRMQFPTGHPLFSKCNPDSVGGTYGLIADPRNNANSEQCMPSLMGNEIRSILSSQPAIRNSTDLQFKSIYNALTPGTPPTFTTMNATGASNNVIEICRRVKGSGTQAQANVIFMGNPCDINTDGSIDALKMRTETDAGSNTINNEGSGDVELCLNDFNNGANATGRNGTSLKRWAIGIQSLEKNAPNFTTNTYANAYRFIKIDGFAPTIANVHAGDYYDFAAQNLQFRSLAPLPAPGVFAALLTTIRDVTVLPSLNKVHAFGTASWLAVPVTPTLVPFNPGLKPDAVLDLTRPVAWYRRVSFAGKFNTCALPSMFNAKVGGVTRLNNSATVGPQNCSNTSVGGPDNNCYTDPNPINMLPTE